VDLTRIARVDGPVLFGRAFWTACKCTRLGKGDDVAGLVAARGFKDVPATFEMPDEKR
jgi:hypothetical protein